MKIKKLGALLVSAALCAGMAAPVSSPPDCMLTSDHNNV